MQMSSRSAIAKLKVILITCLTMASALGGYYYYVTTLPPPPKPAEFRVTDLTISPAEAGVREPITVSAKVTNIGEVEGSYAVKLIINGAVKQTKTVTLAGGASTIIRFEVIEEEEGSYPVEIDGLTGALVIKPPPVFKISGTIVDKETGEPLERVSISIDGFTGLTGADGSYTILNIPPGTYTFRASIKGYEAFSELIMVVKDLTIDIALIPTGSTASGDSGHIR